MKLFLWHLKMAEMVLNLSVRINEAQAQEMIGAKRSFFFTFIEKEVAAIRYQLAQERNYEQKEILRKQKEPFLVKNLLKEMVQLASLTMERMYKLGSPSTRTGRLLHSFSAQLAAEIEFPLERQITVQISGR